MRVRIRALGMYCLYKDIHLQYNWNCVCVCVKGRESVKEQRHCRE